MSEAAAAQSAVPMREAGSQADFAAAHGWSKSYVTKLKQDGRLVLRADGMVDFPASIARIKATTGAPQRAAPVVQGPDYATAQERERHYSAELKRLELERETRRVLPADEVHAVIDDCAATIRTTVEGWAARLPAQLAACGGDEQRIAGCLEYECDALLRGMNEKLGDVRQ